MIRHLGEMDYLEMGSLQIFANVMAAQLFWHKQHCTVITVWHFSPKHFSYIVLQVKFCVKCHQWNGSLDSVPHKGTIIPCYKPIEQVTSSGNQEILPGSPFSGLDDANKLLQKNVTQQCLLHRLFPWLSFIHDNFANIKGIFGIIERMKVL